MLPPPPVLAPTPVQEKHELLDGPTLSRDALCGKLMEVDALLRHKFATHQELKSVELAVDTGLSLLSELPALATWKPTQIFFSEPYSTQY